MASNMTTELKKAGVREEIVRSMRDHGAEIERRSVETIGWGDPSICRRLKSAKCKDQSHGPAGPSGSVGVVIPRKVKTSASEKKRKSRKMKEAMADEPYTGFGSPLTKAPTFDDAA